MRVNAVRARVGSRGGFSRDEVDETTPAGGGQKRKDERTMEHSLFELALSQPALAAATGLALGLASFLSAGWVARWTHVLGLRREPPSHPVWWVGFALLLGVVSGLAAVLPAPGWVRSLLLGLLWGHATMDFANNVRAAVALRAVAGSPAAFERWLELPLYARLALVTASGAGGLVIATVVFLLTFDPGLLGLTLGVAAQLVGQRVAAAAMLVRESSGEGGAEGDGPAPPDAETEET